MIYVCNAVIGIDEATLISYRIEPVLLFISRIILYYRTLTILKLNPDLDENIFEK